MTTVPNDRRIIRSEFQPPFWLRNRQAQTIFPRLPWAYRNRPALRRETLDLPDGDATAIDWVRDSEHLPDDSPLLIILHGLESSSDSTYARMLMQSATDQSWRCCVLHFRDCGDYRNRLPRRYHAGETNDIRFFLRSLQAQGNNGPLLAAGYSLGGNVLLKYLGEAGEDTPLKAAAAVCVPLDLHECAEALNNGFSKVYQRYLLKHMKSAVARKFDHDTAAFDWKRAMSATTFAEFDDAVTAPLHGFASMNDYYDRCSSGRFLKDIQKPTLIINSIDDPFMTPGVLRQIDTLSTSVSFELSDAGGHVGFISGGTPWRPKFYLPGRLIGYFGEHL
ncbi:MAG: hydrolase [Gammaproteobacteria bacterium]|nr:hydrolase [Gammaproteobacteria bacterium]